MLKRNSVLEDGPNEGFHLLGTFAIILLFLTFIGAGFYLFVTNNA
jgi:hypothetical protein